MIHQVKMHEIIEKRLKDLVNLQIILLSYMVSCSEQSPEEWCDNLEVHLKSLEHFQGREEGIVKWLWPKSRLPEGEATLPPKIKYLKEFARYNSTEEVEQKEQWLHLLRKQIDALFDNVNILVERLFEGKKEQIPWKLAAAEFFICFYKDLRLRSHFPPALFTEPGAKRFGRQEFMQDFLKRNSHLYICAICDGSGYYTTTGDAIHTEIEHYLPKSWYPHLAIHPFNLVPMCGQCNLIHGSKDPYEKKGERGYLNDIFLPYRPENSDGLGKKVYLSVELNNNELLFKQDGQLEFNYVRVGDLRPMPGAQNGDELKKFIATLREMYHIPERWNSVWSNQVGETLFRRMRQFLKDGEAISSDFQIWTVASPILDRLLYTLYKEDMSKDPYVFAMSWVLVAVLNEVGDLPPLEQEPTQNGKHRAALLDEIRGWFREDKKLDAERSLLARELKDMIIKSQGTPKE